MTPPPNKPFNAHEVRLKRTRLRSAIAMRNKGLLLQADVTLAYEDLRAAAGCNCGNETRCKCGRMDRVEALT